MNKTQINLLRSAEQEFAERGFHGASIREITRRAGANIAAVNYHFGSKESLFIEMIRHRVEPINTLRHALLEDALAEAGGSPLPVRKLVDILIRPLAEAYLAGAKDKSNQHFMRAIGRGMAEDTKFMAILHRDVLAELLATFRKELARSLENIPDETVNLCFAYLASTVNGAMQQQGKEEPAQLACHFPDADSLVLFISGGIEAIAQDYRENQR